MNSKFFYKLSSLGIFVVFLAIWQIAALSPRIKFFFGSPLAILEVLSTNVVNGILPYDTLITGLEALTGFAIGVTLGTLIGYLLWYSPAVGEISRPYLLIAGSIPVFAFAPMIIIWFGIGITMKIALAAFGTFLIALTQAYEGAKSINLEEFRLLRVFGASRLQVLQKVIFPSALSWVLTSMKLNVGFALLGAFIGEFISADRGLGHFMIRAGSLFDIPSVFAGGAFLVLIALLLNYGVTLVEINKMKIVEFFTVARRVRALLKS